MGSKGAIRQGEWRRLDEMIHGIHTAMLTTLDENGRMRSRPMAALEEDVDGALWFFTRRSTPKVDEIDHDQRVNVTYADPGSERYVSVSGRATLVRDPARAIQLWSPALAAWFPAGPEDRDLALLRVEVDGAEFWDATAGHMVRMFDTSPPPVESRKASAHGRRPEHAR
jgi:general stress protein 26